MTTWADVQEGIRVALRDSAALADSRVAWDHTAQASEWAEYPRIRIQPFSNRIFGLAEENYVWEAINARLVLRVDSCTILRVQVKVESNRASGGLGAQFSPVDRIQKAIRTERIRAALADAGVSVLRVGEFTPFADSYDNTELSVAIGEISFQTNVPLILTPDGESEDWFNIVQISGEVPDVFSFTVFGPDSVRDLLAPGAGLPIQLRSTPFVGSGGADIAVTLPFPGALPIVNGHRYRIGGIFLVRFGNVPISSNSVRDCVLLRSAGAWSEVRAGDLIERTYPGWETYFATAANLPGLGYSGANLQVIARPIDGQSVTVEFFGTVADIGAP